MAYNLINTTPPQGKKTPLTTSEKPLIDSSGRTINYLRLSVTDRCDLRCSYCMPERMKFLPKNEVLNFEELERLVDVFASRGVRKLRITGGEPLVRKDVVKLLEKLGEKKQNSGIHEIALTTNATLLAKYAEDLHKFGIRRINISLDTLNKEMFKTLTRRDVFHDVMSGIHAAKKAGLHIKINTVVLKDSNEKEIPEIVTWAHENEFDISLIELMPMGEGVDHRSRDFSSLKDVKTRLEQQWKLTSETFSTGGPSRYYRVKETGGRIGFISPLTDNFCDGCNRIRVTCTGMLHTCLGHESGIDLKPAIRSDDWLNNTNELLDQALMLKPAKHGFEVSKLDTPSTQRTMSVTGG